MPAVKVLYYTDPYCSWCWATEPQVRKLQFVYGDELELVHRAGGLVEDMATFYDSLNSISELHEVAPHWAEVSQRSGQPIDEKLWYEIEDEHFSTWPANIAFKAAELQGKEAGDRYLRRMREAALTERRHVSDLAVQRELAEESRLDLVAFEDALESGAALRAFEADIREARSKGITGFPTLVFVTRDGRESVLNGHRPFESYRWMVEELTHHVLERREPDLAGYMMIFERATTREIGELLDLEMDKALELLESEVAASRMVREPAANGDFWRLTPTSTASTGGSAAASEETPA